MRSSKRNYKIVSCIALILFLCLYVYENDRWSDRFEKIKGLPPHLKLDGGWEVVDLRIFKTSSRLMGRYVLYRKDEKDFTMSEGYTDDWSVGSVKEIGESNVKRINALISVFDSAGVNSAFSMDETSVFMTTFTPIKLDRVYVHCPGCKDLDDLKDRWVDSSGVKDRWLKGYLKARKLEDNWFLVNRF
jgi:hypothetical protein